MATIKDRFGSNLKRLLEFRDLSAREFALMMDTDEANVSRWVNGKTLPDSTNLDRIALLFAIDCEELFTRDKHRPNLREALEVVNENMSALIIKPQKKR